MRCLSCMEIGGMRSGKKFNAERQKKPRRLGVLPFFEQGLRGAFKRHGNFKVLKKSEEGKSGKVMEAARHFGF